MKLSDFDYPVPRELIAQHPLKKRDSCRLMVVKREGGKIYHDKFCRLLEYLPENSVLVLNDSKVIPARIFGRRITGGRVEVLLLKKAAGRNTFEALINPFKKLKVDERLLFDHGRLSCRLIDPKARLVQFNCDIQKRLNKLGHIPLPPYIKRPDESADKTDYQTVYAKHPGSVASPTAGLHFPRGLLRKIKSRGIGIASVTLHVNYATFNPIKEAGIRQHQMYSEDYSISAATLTTLKAARAVNKKIIAVGTTACRVLETLGQNHLEDYPAKNLSGSTDIFIYPGYKFKLTDALLTNFHFPKTTLLLLVCALAGRSLIMRAYREAIEKKYRFYSYGDAMLIL
ncbi:MAG: tRNA preQ1(34) S-adenosylmethionine ribosyltransferase-isomerase QueA [Candidatus Omnitrophota bacterium]